MCPLQTHGPLSELLRTVLVQLWDAKTAGVLHIWRVTA
jgi:hypothetical protein